MARIKYYDESSQSWKYADTKGGATYTLPIATPDTLGGVKPVAKSEDMTQPVGVDEIGGLWSVPGGGSEWGLIRSDTLENDVSEINLDFGDDWTEVFVNIIARVNDEADSLGTAADANSYVCLYGDKYFVRNIVHNDPIFYTRSAPTAYPLTISLKNEPEKFIHAVVDKYTAGDYGKRQNVSNSCVRPSEAANKLRIWFADTQYRIKAGATVEVWVR